MSELAAESCRRDAPALPGAEATALLAQLRDGWRLADDGKSVRRSFAFEDFYRTMSFVNAVAHVANREDHHPALEVAYDRCGVEFSTHSVGGLSRNDFVCAAKIDRL